jgi:hypothetical protein
VQALFGGCLSPVTRVVVLQVIEFYSVAAIQRLPDHWKKTH